ncbi:hypothetical protein CDIK_2915 [Cucumispora dikerogammari]|nr:hypothetical protein CDIK_2915 [Cucumispora dikerogammari]
MTNNRKSRTIITEGLLNIIRNQINREIKTFIIEENNNLSVSCVLIIQKKIAIKLSNNQIINKKGRKKTTNNILQNTVTALVAQDSAINQRGISESLELIGTTLSQSAVSRKLNAYQLTRKKLTLVPAERNSPKLSNYALIMRGK